MDEQDAIDLEEWKDGTREMVGELDIALSGLAVAPQASMLLHNTQGGNKHWTTAELHEAPGYVDLWLKKSCIMLFKSLRYLDSNTL